MNVIIPTVIFQGRSYCCLCFSVGAIGRSILQLSCVSDAQKEPEDGIGELGWIAVAILVPALSGLKLGFPYKTEYKWE